MLSSFLRSSPFLQHLYDSTGAYYKSKGGLSCLLACLFVLGKFKDDYWLVCEPMRNKVKVAGNLAQLHSTVECTQTVETVRSRIEILAQLLALQSVTVRR